MYACVRSAEAVKGCERCEKADNLRLQTVHCQTTPVGLVCDVLLCRWQVFSDMHKISCGAEMYVSTVICSRENSSAFSKVKVYPTATVQ